MELLARPSQCRHLAHEEIRHKVQQVRLLVVSQAQYLKQEVGKEASHQALVDRSLYTVVIQVLVDQDLLAQRWHKLHLLLQGM